MNLCRSSQYILEMLVTCRLQYRMGYEFIANETKQEKNVGDIETKSKAKKDGKTTGQKHTYR